MSLTSLVSHKSNIFTKLLPSNNNNVPSLIMKIIAWNKVSQLQTLIMLLLSVYLRNVSMTAKRMTKATKKNANQRNLHGIRNCLTATSTHDQKEEEKKQNNKSLS